MSNRHWSDRFLGSVAGKCILGLIILSTVFLIVNHRPRPAAPLPPIHGVGVITAALDRQVAARGQSLEVFYTLTLRTTEPRTGILLPSRPGSPLMIYHYVTTPTLRYLEENDYGPGGRLRATHTYFVDRATGKCTNLHRQVLSGTWSNSAAIGTRLGFFFSCLDLLDPLELRLTFHSVREWLARGFLRPVNEEIDGHQCYCVDAVEDNLNGTIQIWVDPAIGYMPRRVAVATPQGACEDSIDYSEYKEVASGVWYPMRAEIKGYGGRNGRVDVVNYLVASKVALGKKFSRSQLEPVIPPGTRTITRP